MRQTDDANKPGSTLLVSNADGCFLNFVRSVNKKLTNSWSIPGFVANVGFKYLEK